MHRFLCLLVFLALAAPVAAQAPPTVTVASGGAEPRAALRYDLGAIGDQTVHMDMTMSLAMELAGIQNEQTMPTMRTAVSVTSPRASGDTLAFGFSVGSITVLEGPGADPMMVDALRAAFAQLGTVRGSMTIDARGVLLDSTIDLDAVSPAFRQQLEQTVQTVHQSVVPFPDEPVGVGAQWSATESVTAGGMTILQTAAYELIALDGTSARIRTTVTQSADAQVLALEELPPGTTAELLRYTGSGTGEIVVRLDRAMPEGEMTLRTEMDMRTTEPSTGPVDMSMAIGLDATIRNAE